MTEYEQLMAQAKELEAKALSIREAEKSRVITDILMDMHDYGITQSDLFPAKVKTPKSAKVVGPAKYKSLNGEMTWTGKGRKPQWIVEHLTSGGTLEQVAI